MKRVNISFSVSADTIEMQLQSYGYTLGEMAQSIEDMRRAALLLWSNGLLLDWQYARCNKGIYDYCIHNMYEVQP